MKRFKGGVPSADTVVHEIVDDNDDEVKLRQKVISDSADEVEDDEVVIVESSQYGATHRSSTSQTKPKTEAEEMCDALDPVNVARLFRVNNVSLRYASLDRKSSSSAWLGVKLISHFILLSRKDQYQILFFPLTDPLSEPEKGRRKVVTSTTIAPDTD